MALEFDKFDYKIELEKQRDIFSDCFPECVGTSICSETHYMWKFQSFPHNPHSYEYICHENRQYMGYYAAIPYTYSIQGQKMIAGMVCDVMTHSRSRGKGVFTKLGHYSTKELKEANIHFTTGFPIRPEVIPGHLKVGWKIGVHLPIFLTCVSFKGLLQKAHVSFLSPFFDIFLSIYHGLFNVLFSNSKLNYEISLVNDVVQLEDFKSFIEKWEKQVPYHLVKNADFLSWRFSAPQTRYEVVLAKLSGQIVGAAFVREVELKKIPTLAILDYMFLTDYKKHSPSLLNFIKTIAKNKGLTFVATMMSSTWFKKYKFIQSGFIKTPLIFKFISKKLNHNIDEDLFLKESNWHLMWIDCDDL